MQINKISSKYSVYFKQNSQTKNGQTQTQTQAELKDYQQVPIETTKAYSLTQTEPQYKEISTITLPQIGIGKIYELSNKHRIILVPKAGSTRISTNICVGVNNEPAPKKEISHLLEHLIYNPIIKASDNETASFLKNSGADYNATTTGNSTYYYINTIINNNKELDNLIKTHAKTILKPTFTDKDVENEKPIIIQENNSNNYLKNAERISNRITIQNLFNLKDTDDIVNSPSIDTINNINYKDLKDYYNDFYRPENMVTTIIGNVDNNSIKTIAKYFNNKMQEKSENTKYPQTNITNPIQKTIRNDFTNIDKNDKNTHINISFVGPKNNDAKEQLLVEILNTILEKKVTSTNNYLKNFYTTTANINTSKETPSYISCKMLGYDNDTEYNLKTIYQAINELTTTPINDKDLYKIKNYMYDDWSKVVQDPEILTEILQEKAMLGQYIDKTKEEELIELITPKDIQNTAKKYFDLNKASIVVMHPQKDLTKIKSNVIDDTKTEEYDLPNNLRVVFTTNPNITRCDVQLDINSEKNLSQNEFTNIFKYISLSKNYDDIEKSLSSKDIYIKLSGNPQKTSFIMLSSPEDITKGITGLNKLLSNQILEDLDYEKINKSNKEFNEMLSKKTPSEKIFEAIVKESPYYTKEKYNGEINKESFKSQYNNLINNSQGTIFITMPEANLKENKEKILKSLATIPTLKPHNAEKIRNKFTAIPLKENLVFTKELKNTDQISLQRYYKIPKSGNVNDDAGLLILSNIIGGDTFSLMFTKLRNNDKLAYSAETDYVLEVMPSISRLDMITTIPAQKNNLQTSIEEFDNCINEILTKPITQEQLEHNKNSLKKQLLDNFNSASEININIAENYNSYYGKNYQKELIKAIDNITPENIKQLANHYLTMPKITYIATNKETLDKNKDLILTLGKLDKN